MVIEGGTLLTTTVVESVSAPPSPSVTRTLTVKVPLSAYEQECELPDWGPISKVLLPSQSNWYSSGSLTPPGSLAVTVTVELSPSSIGDSALTSLIAGGRLATVTGRVASFDAEVASRTITATNGEAGPSGNEQLNEPVVAPMLGLPTSVPPVPHSGYPSAYVKLELSRSVMLNTYVSL